MANRSQPPSYLDGALDAGLLDRLMRSALRLADASGCVGEVPIGAVVALGDEIVGVGRSRTVERANPLAHAELGALMAAGPRGDAILVSTVAPCLMCLGAAMRWGVRAVVYALSNPRDGASMLAARDELPIMVGGVLEEEARCLFTRHGVKLAPASEPSGRSASPGGG